MTDRPTLNPAEAAAEAGVELTLWLDAAALAERTGLWELGK